MVEFMFSNKAGLSSTKGNFLILSEEVISKAIVLWANWP